MAHPTRLFTHPDQLEQVWKDFKEDLSKQAEEWKKIQYVGKEGDRKADPQKVPYTFEGFKRFCRERYGDVEQYFTNQGGYYSDFVGICSHIKEEIRENQIIGGLLGFYNSSITQRLNGLVDKTESKIDAKVDAVDYSKLSDDALKEIANAKRQS